MLNLKAPSWLVLLHLQGCAGISNVSDASSAAQDADVLYPRDDVFTDLQDAASPVTDSYVQPSVDAGRPDAVDFYTTPGCVRSVNQCVPRIPNARCAALWARNLGDGDTCTTLVFIACVEDPDGASLVPICRERLEDNGRVREYLLDQWLGGRVLPHAERYRDCANSRERVEALRRIPQC
jgi:hypothetical protein